MKLSAVIKAIQHWAKNNNDPTVCGSLSDFDVKANVYDTVEATCKYANYLNRQENEMLRWKRGGSVALPADMIYSHKNLPSLSSEELERLNKVQPLTMHAASCMEGMRPHSLVTLYHFITTNNMNGSGSGSHTTGRASQNTRRTTLEENKQKKKEYEREHKQQQHQHHQE